MNKKLFFGNFSISVECLPTFCFCFQVHNTTGFFEGLFEEDELISENVKDRETKIVFLNKVISVIGEGMFIV